MPQNYARHCQQSDNSISGSQSYLVRGTSDLVDDADVRRPSDHERCVEVDDAGRQYEDRVKNRIARLSSRDINAHVRPQEIRDVEPHVVDPYADDNGHGYACFETRSTDLTYSQESKTVMSESNPNS